MKRLSHCSLAQPNVATSQEVRCSGADYVVAESLEKAAELGSERARLTFPDTDRWYGHEVTVCAVVAKADLALVA